MAITMKGRIFRGLKIIAQIFTAQREQEQEHEMEIGYPTDVRHVSHIGFGAGGSCPSWMNEFRGVEEVAAAVAAGGSISSAAPSRQTSWASIEFEPLPLSQDAAAAIAGSGTTRSAPKRPAAPARLKKARASSPGSSSTWRSTASLATACSDSGDLRPADLRAP